MGVVYIYIYIYEDINILCTFFRFPQYYFRCMVGARDEHVPNFPCRVLNAWHKKTGNIIPIKTLLR